LRERGSRASWGSRAPPAAAARRPRASRRAWARSKVVVHDERGVIREAPLLVYGGGARPAGEVGAHDLVIDAPADVLRARLSAVRPPGVEPRLGSHLAKRVDIARRPEQPVHPGALLGQVPGAPRARSPVGEADCAVRHVLVT